MRTTLSRLLLAALLLGGCSDWPELPGQRAQAARDLPYPVLQPLGSLPRPDIPGIDFAASLQARAAALRERARILTSAVIPLDERRRMLAATRDRG